MTLKEYHRGQPSDLGPSRNPLAEVRWLAFLRGDAYANPFHDLVYAFSRSTAPKKEAVAVAAATGRRELYFGTCDLTLKDESGSTRTFSYEDVGHLKLHYQPDYYTHYESPLLDTAVLVTFFADGKRVELRSRVARVEFIRLCKCYWSNEYPFASFTATTAAFCSVPTTVTGRYRRSRSGTASTGKRLFGFPDQTKAMLFSVKSKLKKGSLAG